MRRRSKPEGSLTSLLDVLFIIVFASLVQQSARGEARVAEAEATAKAATKQAAAPVVPAPPSALVDLRKAAVSVTAKHVEGAPLVAVRVGADGTLVDVEWAGEKHALGLPLLERVPDPDVLVTYLGDRAPALRVCSVVAHELRVEELSGYVVVISPAVALGELPVALVAGLKRDVSRCQAEQQAMAVIVEPSAIAPPPAPAVDGGTP